MTKFCKKCGKVIAEDSIFCQYCGAKQDAIDQISEKKKIEVNASVNATIKPSFKTPFIEKLKSYPRITFVYSLWFIIHIILLASGDGRRGFFPKIYYSDYGTYSERGWKIEWDLDRYGLPEFLIYVLLIPLLVFGICKFYKVYKIWYNKYFY